jgi:hypothetical protein
MKRVSELALAAVAATAIIAGSAAAASAAPAQAVHYQATAASASGSGVTVPLKLSAGRHTVAFTTEATAASGSGSAYVNIRVGKNNCGGYKGTVSWSQTSIGATGTLWDNCNYYTPNTTVYLYISWSNSGGSGNPSLASVSGTKNTENIGHPGKLIIGLPQNLAADTCLKWNNGWGCGPAQTILRGSV